MISLLEYQKNLGKKPIKPVNLIHGEEEYLVKTFLDRLKELYTVRILWGDELSLQDFERLASTGGMFGKEETFFVYWSLEFLKSIKDDKRLLSLLSKIKDKRFFFHVESKLTEKDLQKEPFLTISNIGDVISASRLDKRRIRELVKNKLQKEGVNLDEMALEYLLEATSYDLMQLKGETDKILLYGKKHINIEDIKTILVADVEMGLFDFVDGVFLKDYEKALSSLSSVLRMGVHPLQAFSLLVNYALKLYTSKSLIEEGKKPEEALHQVDVKHAFQIMNFKKYLEKNSKESLKSLLKRLYILDINMKVYYSDPSSSLRHFVIEYMLNEESVYISTDSGNKNRSNSEP
ncbi:MAG: DNA polymerase III subunit delta [Aquificaceae bacterium]|nr:DNA polymerase III subunit delta [Aquificaceae bacterium]